MRFRIACLVLALPATAMAHDVWIQTNSPVVRPGNVVHCDLMLGNHGAGHRDFKLASKLGADATALEIVDPSGRRINLKDRLVDLGLTPKEGYWSARYEPKAAGLYVASSRDDRVMSYAPERSIKGAKAYFLAAESLDSPPREVVGFDHPLGHDLEIVPLTSPFGVFGHGRPIRVRLLHRGRPLAGASIAFLPRGIVPAEGRDDRYERTTGVDGEAEFEPTEPNRFLIVAHKDDPTASGSLDGKPYEFTRYAATLTLDIPRLAD